MNTVDAQEIKNFSKDSAHWWDENGAFKPLHKLNPVRLKYIKQQICTHFRRDFEDFQAFEGLKILDIGCGGGLVCEPMSRLGADVTGIDADARAIEIAKTHAEQSGLNIEYLNISTSELVSPSPSPLRGSPPSPMGRGCLSEAKTGEGQYDIVLALEIIEHVSNPDQFVREAIALCKPNGLILFSTLNRTPQSYALGIIAAEYLLHWVPKGTHHWKKFIKPSELARMIRHNGATPKDIRGMVFDPVKRAFTLKPRHTAVNYFLSATKD